MRVAFLLMKATVVGGDICDGDGDGSSGGVGDSRSSGSSVGEGEDERSGCDGGVEAPAADELGGAAWRGAWRLRRLLESIEEVVRAVVQVGVAVRGVCSCRSEPGERTCCRSPLATAGELVSICRAVGLGVLRGGASSVLSDGLGRNAWREILGPPPSKGMGSMIWVEGDGGGGDRAAKAAAADQRGALSRVFLLRCSRLTCFLESAAAQLEPVAGEAAVEA